VLKDVKKNVMVNVTHKNQKNVMKNVGIGSSQKIIKMKVLIGMIIVKKNVK
jgi:hypothetical protein